MKKFDDRRAFLKKTALASISFAMPRGAFITENKLAEGRRVGLIGLDTSHSVVFTKVLNDPAVADGYSGYKVVAAYPYGSKSIETSMKMIPPNIDKVKEMGVEIAGSIKEVLDKADVILLETNDGRLHLEQALQVIKAGKPLFIDKPMTASLADALSIFEAAKKYKVPIFSSSSLRFMNSAQEVVNGKIGKVTGADVYSPAIIEKTHPDLFWYGVHGVETLFTIMGRGCKQVVRVNTEFTDLVIGTWSDNRLGSFRGIRNGKNGYGGTAFGEAGIATVGPFEGYQNLLVQIIQFFLTGKAPVSPDETLEIFAFMEAAEESKKNGGATVNLADMMIKAEKSRKQSL